MHISTAEYLGNGEMYDEHYCRRQIWRHVWAFDYHIWIWTSHILKVEVKQISTVSIHWIYVKKNRNYCWDSNFYPYNTDSAITD